MTTSFAAGYSFGCAFVQEGTERSDGVDTMWAFGRGANSSQVTAFWSTDLATWKQGPGVQLTGFGHTANDYEVFNNNVHKGRDKVSMVFEPVTLLCCTSFCCTWRVLTLHPFYSHFA
jgi:hypothetical protein